jgi:heme/copper-type cytochrome/quinol oxidase subunit 2
MAEQHSPAADQVLDTVDAVVPMIPIVLPVVGALVIFLLAFIAVTMA